MAENFDLIFGQSASSQYEWNDSDYQNGWGTVGSTPPTAEQFDALQRRSDKKAQELNSALTPLVNQSTASNRQPLTAYALKDIRYYNGLPVGWYLECSTAGTSSGGDITLPTPLAENATIMDGTVTWKVRKISSADGMPIGAVIAYGGNGNIPSGYLLCDGSAVSRTMYPDLFAAIGTDYGSGDGSTTFNVPDANQAKRFLQGDVTAGTVKSAGLPNITGTVGGFQIPSKSGSTRIGAFNESHWTTSTTVGTTNGGVIDTLDIDASNSSPIYGNSDTVQPPALTMRYIIKAFNGMTHESALIDVTQFAQELANKADRSLSNLTDVGKSFSFPSDTHVDITSVFSSNNATYTAPANGYISVIGTSTGNAAAIIIAGNTQEYIPAFTNEPTAGLALQTFLPVYKGANVKMTVINATVAKTQFFYAQGEVPS